MSLLQRYNSGYIQDDCRISKRLTMNLGYRYEYISPYGDKFSQIGRFNPTAIEPVTKQKGVYQWVPAGGYHNDPTYNTPGPRVGLAYQLTFQNGLRSAGAHFHSRHLGP